MRPKTDRTKDERLDETLIDLALALLYIENRPSLSFPNLRTNYSSFDSPQKVRHNYVHESFIAPQTRDLFPKNFHESVHESSYKIAFITRGMCNYPQLSQFTCVSYLRLLEQRSSSKVVMIFYGRTVISLSLLVAKLIEVFVW